MANIEEKVENLLKDTIEKQGYMLYDVQYVKEGPNYFLRIFIEKEEGSIDLNDCEKVNNAINDILDNSNYINEQYFLEVSSTGLEKVLRKDKHLKENIGKEVKVGLFKPIEILEVKKKQKEVQGILEDANENEITLKLENENILKLERKNISLIKTVFDWDSI